MKSLVLKDIYNISHNIKQLMFTLIFIGICLIPSTGGSGFSVTVAIIFCMMTVTTFSMDERSNWTKYALIMPVTRKDYVAGKYIINLIFSAVGALLGGVLGTINELVQNKFELMPELGCVMAGIGLGLLFGSLFIPLIIKYGSEQARIISIGAVAIPLVGMYIIYMLMKIWGIQLTDNMVIGALIAMPIIIALISYISFKISVRIMDHKEF